MSTLEELRTKLEDEVAFEASAEIGLNLIAALEAIEDLHRPIEATYFSGDDEYSATVCGTCLSESEETPEPYPRPTLTSVTEALA